MKNMPESNKSSKNGFTLVEIMVSVAIIGILSAVIFPSFLSARSKARDTKRISDMKQIEAALEVYFDQCGTYPRPLPSALVEVWGDGTTKYGALVISVIDDRTLDENIGCPSGVSLRKFISKIPVPPVHGNYFRNYRYAVNVDSNGYFIGTEYHLSTRLEGTPPAIQDAAHFDSLNSTNPQFYLPVSNLTAPGYSSTGIDASLSPSYFDIHSK